MQYRTFSMLPMEKLATANVWRHKRFVFIDTRDVVLLIVLEALHENLILFRGLSIPQNKFTLYSSLCHVSTLFCSPI